VQFKEVNTDEFRAYASQVIKNSQALAKGLMDRGEKLICDGTVNHLVMWDVR
jgi:glycine hydroxymethyltransferase